MLPTPSSVRGPGVLALFFVPPALVLSSRSPPSRLRYQAPGTMPTASLAVASSPRRALRRPISSPKDNPPPLPRLTGGERGCLFPDDEAVSAGIALRAALSLSSGRRGRPSEERLGRDLRQATLTPSALPPRPLLCARRRELVRRASWRVPARIPLARGGDKTGTAKVQAARVALALLLRLGRAASPLPPARNSTLVAFRAARRNPGRIAPVGVARHEERWSVEDDPKATSCGRQGMP